ncbi:LysR family transcriptional regulator [Salisediminibacterium beveridgei]|uniref:Transcriptional regulator, LysR family n=1 Tax=Salisediminibacterium beveridgei TaxID=632773 RepID=A0A1D7QZ81_9BACI|nr:LysR family transcriptional regulator [Salisediminibacterium beveridgei]AOM84315.1 transcriptional regulator, LysR family [Salisediminibacterium beveridgei]
MHLKRLETFTILAEERNFSATAQRLNISQPAITKQIKALEEEAGFPLIHRDTMTLTEAGQVIFDEGKSLIRNWEQVRNKAARIHSFESGKLQIGASSIPGTYLLPKALGSLQTAQAHLDLCIIMDASDQIIDKLRHYELDIAFVGSKPDDDRLDMTCLAQDELIAVGTNHIASINSFTELKKHPLITYREGSGTLKATKDAIRAFGGSYEEMDIVASVPNTAGALALAASGIGIAIVSTYALGPESPQALVPLAHLQTDRHFYAVQHPNHKHPRSSELIEEVQKIIHSQS